MKTGKYILSMREYLNVKALSSGMCADLLTRTPYHVKYEQDNPDDDSSEVSDTGTAIHDALLEGVDRIVPVDADSWRTKAAKEQRDLARAEGKIPLLVAKVPHVKAAVAAARAYVAQSAIAGVFDNGEAETTLIWTETHDDGEILCKARPDWLSGDTLVHVKTTKESVNPRTFARLASNQKYDISLMFYMRGLEAVAPDADVNHVILAIEQQPPYACKLFDLTAARQDVAERQVERAIGQWARCLASGRFPAYDSSVHSIDLQPWELAQAEEDLLTDDELQGGIPA